MRLLLANHTANNRIVPCADCREPKPNYPYKTETICRIHFHHIVLYFFVLQVGRSLLFHRNKAPTEKPEEMKLEICTQ